MDADPRSPAQHDSLASFPFRLSCSGRTVAAFSEASALMTDFARPGDSGGGSWPAIQAGQAIMTLRRGLVTDPSFLSWIEQSSAPQEPLSKSPLAHRDLVLTIFGETGCPVATHLLPNSTACGFSACAALVDSHGIAALDVLHVSCRLPHRTPSSD